MSSVTSLMAALCDIAFTYDFSDVFLQWNLSLDLDDHSKATLARWTDFVETLLTLAAFRMDT